MTTTESPAESTVKPTPRQTTDANEQHKVNLLEQFYLTLQVTYLSAPQSAGSVIHERIEKLFQREHSWPIAYEIEQLLCFVISEQQLETELNRRLAEAQALKLDYVAVIDKELHPDGKPPGDKRIVLHRLLNDLQWFYSKRVQHRAASKRLLVRVSLLFMVALAAFSLVLFIQFFAHEAPTRAATGATGGAGSQGARNQGGGTQGAGAQGGGSQGAGAQGGGTQSEGAQGGGTQTGASGDAGSDPLGNKAPADKPTSQGAPTATAPDQSKEGTTDAAGKGK